jgi:hypothetical protein
VTTHGRSQSSGPEVGFEEIPVDFSPSLFVSTNRESTANFCIGIARKESQRLSAADFPEADFPFGPSIHR